MQFIAVFDTNILLSALLWPKGNPFRCMDMARMGRVGSVTCHQILEEFQEKLILKFEFSSQKAGRAAREIELFSRVVSISGTLNVVKSDPDDDKVIECALVGDATHVITRDKRHLLPLRQFEKVQIVSAAQFMTMTEATTP